MTENLSVQTIITNMCAADKIAWKKLLWKEKVIRHIMLCHTEEYGMSVEECPDCKHRILHYGSCNDSSCPMCGTLRRFKWALDRQDDLVDAEYNHVIFTVPSSLNELFLVDMKFMCSLLFKASREATCRLAKDKKFLGAKKTGAISILHTWGQKMDLHPHVHMLFVAGGLDKDGNWVVPKKEGFLFPVKKLASEYKELFLRELEKHPSEEILKKFPDLSGRIKELRDRDWNVQICPSTADPEHIIEYFARYANRLAISNSRLVSYKDGKVTFKYKDNKDGGKWKKLTLTDEEFFRRFCMYILPPQFQKIRNYGFLSNVSRKKMIPLIRELIGMKRKRQSMCKRLLAYIEKMIGRKPRICPKCQHRMSLTIYRGFLPLRYEPDELTPLEKEP